MKKLLIVVSFVSFASLLFAGEIKKHTAVNVAVNFFFERVSQYEQTAHWNIVPDEIYALKLDGDIMMFAVNIYGGGFVLVSATDLVRPVPGYSLTGKFNDQGLPPQLEDLLTQYKLQIQEAMVLNTLPNQEIKSMWERLSTGDISLLQPLKSEKAVEPMLHTTWDQGTLYNEMCPADPTGPGGHCYAGCVATALGQVVNYFRWPETGTGSYSYECPPYGTLTANYGETTYEWDKMASSLNKSNLPVALLLNHLGIACDMVYGPNGSGMYNHKAAYALRTFFKYSPETIYVYRDSTNLDWDSLLVSHLDRSIPMYYAGWSVPNINGHAFVCDGYQAGNYYHFNWGWSGSNDGYFYTDNLSPGGSNFNLAQELIINAFPDTNAYTYPYYCQGNKILEGTDGTIDDGSGPVYDYLPDAGCSWLIAPSDSVENITVEFLEFTTEMGDILTIYDGETTAAPVLATFQGPDVPGDITSSGDKMLITFNSDAAGSAPGWLLSYEAEIPVYCSGMANMNEQSGTITDGSGPRDYHNGSTCMWMVSPPGASELTLYFTAFSTEEGYDLVKVFDPDSQDLLAELSGDTLPGPIVSPSGKIFMTFSTNYTVTAPGWEAWYETDLVKVEENLLEESLRIFPNPAGEHVILSFRTKEVLMVNVSVTDMTGQMVLSRQYTSVAGENTLPLNTGVLETGIYIVKVGTGSSTIFRKLIRN